MVDMTIPGSQVYNIRTFFGIARERFLPRDFIPTVAINIHRVKHDTLRIIRALRLTGIPPGKVFDLYSRRCQLHCQLFRQH